LASEDRAPQKKPLEFFRGAEFLTAVTRTEPTKWSEGSGEKRHMLNEAKKGKNRKIYIFSKINLT